MLAGYLVQWNAANELSHAINANISFLNQLMSKKSDKTCVGIYDQGEPIEFEKWPIEVEEFKRITDHFRGMLGNIPPIKKEKPEDMNWLWPQISSLEIPLIGIVSGVNGKYVMGAFLVDSKVLQ